MGETNSGEYVRQFGLLHYLSFQFFLSCFHYTLSLTFLWLWFFGFSITLYLRAFLHGLTTFHQIHNHQQFQLLCLLLWTSYQVNISASSTLTCFWFGWSPGYAMLLNFFQIFTIVFSYTDLFILLSLHSARNFYFFLIKKPVGMHSLNLPCT
jgi:hypothetical protein